MSAQYGSKNEAAADRAVVSFFGAMVYGAIACVGGWRVKRYMYTARAICR